MGIVLYYTPMSSATKVQWALEELGIPYDKVKIDLSKGEHRQPQFLALNPNGKVPCMVVDGQPVFESLAMLLYLGETFGVDKGLFPAPGAQRLEAFKWMAWGSVSLAEASLRLMRNTSGPPDQRSAGAATAARTEITDLVHVLDTSIAGRQFVLGDKFSLVDCALGTMIWVLGQRLHVDLAPYANVGAWTARIMDRPALARAMAG
jgi:glutathione S-transferase